MNFTKLKLNNFRNHLNLKIELKEKTTNIYGPNGVGKTSIIEAIEIVSFGKSISVKKEKNLINNSQEEYNIQAEYLKNDILQKIEITYSKKGVRKIKVNEKVVKKVSDYINNLQIIKFSPSDMFLIRSDQVQKRKYIDILIAKTNHKHLLNLQTYNNLLKQKNKTLKEIKYYNRGKVNSLIKVLNDQIVEVGMKIQQTREETINLINEMFQKINVQKNEVFNIKYNSDFKSKSKEQILKLINDKSIEEIEKGYSIYGIQRDKIEFMLEKELIDLFCSQGQKRTFILILKRIESDLIKKAHGIYPLALLDDVLNELDEERKEKILNLFKNNQIITTSTQEIKVMENIYLKE